MDFRLVTGRLRGPRTTDNRRAIQIWHETDGAAAMMRLDQVAYSCAWTSPRTLAVAGAAGLYRFRLRR